MSKIWDSVRLARKGVPSTPDRRRGRRVLAYAPVLVYGHTTGNEPFHEPTEALHVNARGGLITLTTAVEPGNPILLINKANHKEQKCRLVGYRGTYLKRRAIGFEFEFFERVPDFWDAK
jgi:hypothetical protein